MNYQSFVDGKRTLLISPAGYGKTHTIVECLKYTSGRQLILTHTHAGISSIKDKIKQEGISSDCYHIETISSFAQKYVQSFHAGLDMPDQEKSQEYHHFIIENAIVILSSKIVQQTLTCTYTGVFVDEYQDCTKQQHEMILAIASMLPIHVLGDPLQSIFDFNGEAVNILEDLSDFERFPDLDVPHRWYKNDNNKELGNEIKLFRTSLLRQEPLLLANNQDIGLHVFQVQEGDLLDKDSDYRKKLNHIITNRNANPDLESLLVVVPEYEEVKASGQRINKGDIWHRAMIKSQIDYTKSLILLEAIDDKSFYALAKEADVLISGIKRSRNKIKSIKNNFFRKIFNATEIAEWFNADGFKVKRTLEDKGKTEKVNFEFERFFTNPNGFTLIDLLLEAKGQFKFKIKRDDVFKNLITALKHANIEKVSVYEAMKNNRNHIRRSGRKIYGKCIGTTLLTKGLEFNTVVILDAHRFDTPEHLYVALTRCCKKLIIFTSDLSLSPY